ncbi:hypothetical protein [Burkholderia sp. Bp8986]|uniref:hypothetical protein n=1 Tax=Burkholderia sp. Bp8986 TaxID=2184550 RepID=UPI000F596D6E|nr:hypothetical protein [Burkholderia sp. Bp8986]RQS42700.1 hypothetical protein DID99_35655 [Burkholderia sp. Bp8986]
MTLWDWIKDRFFGGHKAEILESLTFCHIASVPAGRDYLKQKDELEHVAKSGRNLLSNLTATARADMVRSALFSGGLITLTFPAGSAADGSIGLRLPLLSECFGDESGSISQDEAVQLIATTLADEGTSATPDVTAHTERERMYLDATAASAAVALLSRACDRLTCLSSDASTFLKIDRWLADGP